MRPVAIFGCTAVLAASACSASHLARPAAGHLPAAPNSSHVTISPPSWTSRCLGSGRSPARQFIGLPYDAARLLAAQNHIHLRLFGVDGHCLAQTTQAIVRPTVALTVGANERVLTAQYLTRP